MGWSGTLRTEEGAWGCGTEAGLHLTSPRLQHGPAGHGSDSNPPAASLRVNVAHQG